MLGIILAIGLGLWLVLSIGRKPKALMEASIFVFFIIFSVYLMNRSLPEIDKYLVVSWFFQWVYIFFVFWFFDVICLDLVSTVIYVAVVSIGYYYFQLYSLGWAEFFFG